MTGEERNGLEHEQVDWRSGASGEDLGEGRKPVPATVEPVFLLLLLLVVHGDVEVSSGTGTATGSVGLGDVQVKHLFSFPSLATLYIM